MQIREALSRRQWTRQRDARLDPPPEASAVDVLHSGARRPAVREAVHKHKSVDGQSRADLTLHDVSCAAVRRPPVRQLRIRPVLGSSARVGDLSGSLTALAARDHSKDSGAAHLDEYDRREEVQQPRRATKGDGRVQRRKIGEIAKGGGHTKPLVQSLAQNIAKLKPQDRKRLEQLVGRLCAPKAGAEEPTEVTTGRVTQLRRFETLGRRSRLGPTETPATATHKLEWSVGQQSGRVALGAVQLCDSQGQRVAVDVTSTEISEGRMSAGDLGGLVTGQLPAALIDCHQSLFRGAVEVRTTGEVGQLRVCAAQGSLSGGEAVRHAHLFAINADTSRQPKFI